MPEVTMVEMFQDAIRKAEMAALAASPDYREEAFRQCLNHVLSVYLLQRQLQLAAEAQRAQELAIPTLARRH